MGEIPKVVIVGAEELEDASSGRGELGSEGSFDLSLGRHGGTRYRGVDGRFASNPDKGKLWYCQKSPTGAHHWIITTHQGRCKYCQAVQELPTPASSAFKWHS